MKKLLIAPVFLTVIFCSCGNFGTGIKEMKAMHDRIEQQLNLKEVDIQIVNGKSLNVSVINSAYSDSSGEAKQQIADSISAICSSYIHAAKLDNGSVIFVKKSSYGIVNTSSSTDSYPMHVDY